MLIVFAGLPGVGKTTIAREVARRLKAVYLRIDTIEFALHESGVEELGPMGYVVAYRVALDNLRLGQTVVADSVNPIQLTRNAWRQVAADAGVLCLEVEVVCSDLTEHRRRVESRISDIQGFRPPSWQEVVDREYHSWDVAPLQLDSSRTSVEEGVGIILRTIET
jgi:predicted kinase